MASTTRVLTPPCSFRPDSWDTGSHQRPERSGGHHLASLGRCAAGRRAPFSRFRPITSRHRRRRCDGDHPLVYDFWGFPDPSTRSNTTHRVHPISPIRSTGCSRGRPGLLRQEDRGLDHGTWVPLLHMYPEADVPVLQLSLPWTNDRARCSNWAGDSPRSARRRFHPR